jgi:hypothetical protein
MKKVQVYMHVFVEFEVSDEIAQDEDKLYEAINEMDYSFNSYEKDVLINDYYIKDFIVCP